MHRRSTSLIPSSSSEAFSALPLVIEWARFGWEVFLWREEGRLRDSGWRR